MDIIRYLVSRKDKNSNFWYYLHNLAAYCLPNSLFRRRLPGRLAKSAKYDRNLLASRVSYYNKLDCPFSVAGKTTRIKDFKYGPTHSSCYFFDLYEYARHFPADYRMAYLFGDVTTVPETPAFVKSRPIAGDNRNSVLLKLDRNRHFVFIRDKKAFSEKRDRLIGRGNMIQPHRVKFMEMYFGHPLCDLGHVSDRDEGTDRRWRVAKSTKAEHLDFKFILALEGNDVATNLKWVMSSNSLAVTPKPLYETWFMEGTLIPGRHYVEIRRDYADLEEKMNYYLEHPGEAERIIENAHLHVGQFRDKTLESIVSLLVLEKYFSLAAT